MPTKKVVKSKKAVKVKNSNLEYQAADSFDEIKKSSVKKSKLPLIILLAVVILGLAVYLNKNLFVVAVVNGQPITRIALIKELEKENGQKTLESMITKNLILQEIARQEITISDEEINQEIKSIETNVQAQGQTLDALLQAQSLTREELQEQIKLQKQIEEILGADIAITDEEIASFLETNKQFLPEGKTDEELKTLAKEQLVQQKIDEKFQTWLDSLQQNAKISNYL